MGSVRHSHALLASLRVHGRDVEDEIGARDAFARPVADRAALLALGVAHSARLKPFERDFDLITGKPSG